MARGDVVNEIWSIDHTGYQTYQPASGTEVCIKSAGGVAHVAAVSVGIYDGTNYATFFNMSMNGSDITLPINNTHYLRMYNGSGGTNAMGYSGYITKD
tara:strand:+ start:137 stop:430 length:294 start_codon:yes stop_codon:yes gene_type:complete